MDRMYAIYDRAAEEAGPVFTARNDAVAIRQMRQLLEKVPAYDRDSYKLYMLGEYDSSSMRVTVREPSWVEFEKISEAVNETIR